MSELRLKSTGTIKLFESDNTSNVTIASPASLTTDRTITLPDGDVTLVAGTMSTGGVALTGSTNNQVTTVTGADAITGESGLIFDGTGLGIGTATMGAKLTVEGNVSGKTLVLDDGVNNNMAVTHASGKITIGANGSNALYLAANSIDAIIIDTTGVVTKPLQPAFFGNITSAVYNVTGDGTRYSYVPNELADRNNDFSTSTFTAPVAGLYLATISHNLAGISSMESGIGYIATSNRSHYWNFNPDNLANAAGSIGFSQSQICDMDASDTLVFEIKLTGGSKVADIEDTTTMAVWLLG